MGVKTKILYDRLKSSKLVRGFIATLFGSGLSKIILVLLTFYCTNTLMKDEFGEFSFIRNTLNTLLCICGLNFSSLCTKFTVEAKVSKDGFAKLSILFIFSICICIVVGLLLIILPSDVLSSLLGYPSLVHYFKIIGLLLPLFMMQPLIEGVLRGFKKFKTIGFLQIISSTFFFLLLVYEIKNNGFEGSIISIFLYYTFFSLISILTIILLKNTLKEYNFSSAGLSKNISSNRKVVFTMVLPIFVMSFIEAPIFWISQLILARYDTMGAVGGMTAITQIRNIAVLIPSYFFSTFLAFAGEMNAEKQYEAYFNKFSQMIRLFTVIGILLAVLFSVFGKFILSLYGDAYSSDLHALFIANLGTVLLLLANLLRVDMVIQEHQRILLLVSIIWNTLWLLLLFLFLNIGIKPINSFFASQLIGIIIQFFGYLMTYKKDRRILLNSNTKILPLN